MLALLIAATGCSDDPIAPTVLETYASPEAFEAATAGLGVTTVVDFEDVDAGPLHNDLAGRTAFDGDSYSSQGVRFVSPDGTDMYLAPGGLFWNESNSLSVGNFPFGSDAGAPDNLEVVLSPAVSAIGFTLVDNGDLREDESIEFLDSDGQVIVSVDLPPDFRDYRAFVGVVSTPRSISTVRIVEADDDGDDVNYDDFTMVGPG
jgi:hypothetical protein